MIYWWRMRQLCKRKGHVWVRFHNFDTGKTWYECSVCGRRQ